MSQKNDTVNFLIHDTNGQPQMVKVVQNTTKQPTAQIKINPNTVKVIKVPYASDGSQQTPIYRAVKVTNIKGGSKLVQVPIHTLAQLQTGRERKVQPQNLPDVKVIHTVPELVPIPAKQTTVVTTVAASPSNSKIQTPLIMSHAPRKRHDDSPVPEYTTKRRKHADKVGKGLRHFSMKVCEKVRTKGFTSYNEVADELVAEFAAGMHGSAHSQQYDQKNIRRRVYDALNVLMAMNIISKEKKEIRWLGLPTNSIQECNTLEKEKQSRLEKIQKKTQQLQELILQHISFKSLVERNKLAESKGVKPSASSAIHLPFIVVNTSDKALIDCRISNDKTEYMFNFNKRFQIHDDIDILKRMGLLFGLEKGECTEKDLEKAKSMIPKSLEAFVEQMGRGVTTKLTDIIEGEMSDDEDEETVGVERTAVEGETSEADDENAEEDATEGDNEHHDEENFSDDSDDIDV